MDNQDSAIGPVMYPDAYTVYNMSSTRIITAVAEKFRHINSYRNPQAPAPSFQIYRPRNRKKQGLEANYLACALQSYKLRITLMRDESGTYEEQEIRLTAEQVAVLLAFLAGKGDSFTCNIEINNSFKANRNRQTDEIELSIAAFTNNGITEILTMTLTADNSTDFFTFLSQNLLEGVSSLSAELDAPSFGLS